MAKSKRRVNRHSPKHASPAAVALPSEKLPSETLPPGNLPPATLPPSTLPSVQPPWVQWCRRIASGLLGAMVVYAAYYPSDSIQVETGDAHWFCAMALALFTLTLSTQPYVRFSSNGSGNRASKDDGLKSDLLEMLKVRGVSIDVVVWSLAAWMMIAALASCPPGNLREATNEAWLWIAGAAVLSSARRLLVERRSQAMAIAILFAVSTGMAVHALHQEWISLPQTRAEYAADPDKVLEAAGVPAPPWSSRRMVFENRLMDGGPTATFALANSLAAAMMMSVIMPVGLLSRFRTAKWPGWINVALVLIAGAGFSALIATRSRSAVLACFVGVGWIWISKTLSSRGQSLGKKTVVGVALSLVIAVGLTLAGVMIFGDEEWMTAALASLEFRIQYWKATIALLTDHPFVGAGPGGFQSLYLQYRLPIASETISDPHNFLFETLAAGGIIGGLLLLALIASVIRHGRLPEPSSRAVSFEISADQHQWMAWGAMTALALVWLFGLASSQMPDTDASVFVLPVALFAGWLGWKTLDFPSLADANLVLRVVASVMTAVLVHLLVSGGWTVPGVALTIWIAASILAGGRNENSKTELSDAGANATKVNAKGMAAPWGLAGFVVGASLLVVLRTTALGPAQASQLAQYRAESAVQRGMTSLADEESQAAVDLDPWGFRAALWRSELMRSRLIGNDSPVTRSAWEMAIDTALKRSGQNPLVQRAIAEQSIHLYQRFGKKEDLERADQLLSLALQGNPTDASLTAQAGVIAAELSQMDRCQELSDRAWQLSELGGNLVRHLDLKQILEVTPRGDAASSGPILRPASKLLAQRLQ